MLTQKLKALRESRKMNQEEVAELLGITKNTYLKYEKGEQSPKLNTVEKMAELYGITLVELISDETPEISEKLKAQMKLINKLSNQEKEAISIILEGVLLRSQNIAITGSMEL